MPLITYDTMTLSDLSLLCGTLGGFEAIKWVISSVANRASTKKKLLAEAEHTELANLNDYAESWKELYTEAKAENKELNVKIDSLYEELRTLRECKANHVRNEHKLELEVEMLRLKKCDIRHCTKREPPSEY